MVEVNTVQLNQIEIYIPEIECFSKQCETSFFLLLISKQ